MFGSVVGIQTVRLIFTRQIGRNKIEVFSSLNIFFLFCPVTRWFMIFMAADAKKLTAKGSHKVIERSPKTCSWPRRIASRNPWRIRINVRPFQVILISLDGRAHITCVNNVTIVVPQSLARRCKSEGRGFKS